MLRVEIHDSANRLSLKLEGRFTGDDAENTRTLMARCHDGMTPVVDLTEVTFIDSVGEEVLSFFGRFGAEFVAPTSYALDICERLHLRLARGGVPNANKSSTARINARRRKPR
ncbi:MAG: STAS domain-containing protein [Candidatus Acidiferrales bacterium]